MGTFIAVLTGISLLWGLLSLVRDIRYDRNTQTFLKQDVMPIIKHALGIIAISFFFGGVAAVVATFALTIVGVLLSLVSSASQWNSTEYATTVNTIATIIGMIGAGLGGLLAFIGMVQEWQKTHLNNSPPKAS